MGPVIGDTESYQFRSSTFTLHDSELRQIIESSQHKRDMS